MRPFCCWCNTRAEEDIEDELVTCVTPVSMFGKSGDLPECDNPAPLAPRVAQHPVEEDLDDPRETSVSKNCNAGLLIAETALRQVASCMKDFRILEAERTLGEALEHLRASDDERRHEEVQKLRSSALFAEVMERCAQFTYTGRQLLADDGDGMELIWQRHDAKVWCRVLPGQNVFEVKAAIEIAAPLSACLVCGQEFDLMPEWNKMMTSPPITIGPTCMFHVVVHSIINVLMFRLETIAESVRICNKDFGFFMESMSTDFPHEDLPMPERSWRSIMLSADIKSLFLPQGGGSVGTVLVQLSRFAMGAASPAAC